MLGGDLRLDPRGLLAGTVIAVVLLLAPAARAQTTIGAPLDQAANGNAGCEVGVLPELIPVLGVPPNCTLWGSLDPAASWTMQVPKGKWVITQARVRTGNRVGPMAFTIIEAMRSQAGAQGVICCTAPAESQVFTPAPNTVNTVALQLPAKNTVENIDGEPVEVVDYLGISMLDLNSELPVHVALPGTAGSGATTPTFLPAIRAGGQELLGPTLPRTTLLANADILPCAGGQTAAAKRACATAPPAGDPPTTPSPTPAPGPAGDTSVDGANANGTAQQRLGRRLKLKTTVASQLEDVTATASGKIAIANGKRGQAGVRGRAGRGLKLTRVTKPVPAATSARLRQTLAGSKRAVKRSTRKLKRALKRGLEVRAKLSISFEDAAGNVTTTSRVVRLVGRGEH